MPISMGHKSLNVVKIKAVETTRPKPFKRVEVGEKADLVAELARTVGFDNWNALDMAINLRKFEEHQRLAEDCAAADEEAAGARARAKEKGATAGRCVQFFDSDGRAHHARRAQAGHREAPRELLSYAARRRRGPGGGKKGKKADAKKDKKGKGDEAEEELRVRARGSSSDRPPPPPPRPPAAEAGDDEGRRRRRRRRRRTGRPRRPRGADAVADWWKTIAATTLFWARRRRRASRSASTSPWSCSTSATPCRRRRRRRRSRSRARAATSRRPTTGGRARRRRARGRRGGAPAPDLDAEIDDRVARRVGNLAPAARIWRSHLTRERVLDLDRVAAALVAWTKDGVEHGDAFGSLVKAFDDQTRLVKQECAQCCDDFLRRLRVKDARWDRVVRHCVLKMTAKHREVSGEMRLQYLDDMELQLGDVVDARTKTAHDIVADMCEASRLTVASATEQFAVLAAALASAEASRFSTGALTLDDYQQAVDARPSSLRRATSKKLSHALAALEAALASCSSPDVAHKVQDAAALVAGLAARPASATRRQRKSPTCSSRRATSCAASTPSSRASAASRTSSSTSSRAWGRTCARWPPRMRAEHRAVANHGKHFRADLRAGQIVVRDIEVEDDAITIPEV
ncbi:hypothetical protein JL720_8863 [Aureococcus anophagefferens]|nr:hypothetical protein JL720_8863 [Aureococcus anophagefferens]